MAAAASRAEELGPRGFSLASIRTASFGTLYRRACASIGSVTMRSASAADVAADRLRNERRDGERTLKSLPVAMAHLTMLRSWPQSYRKISIFDRRAENSPISAPGNAAFVLTFPPRTDRPGGPS